MKLVYFDDFRLGVLAGESVVDVTSLVQDIPPSGPHDLIGGLIEHVASAAQRARLPRGHGQEEARAGDRLDKRGAG